MLITKFEEQVALAPEAIALKTSSKSITYHELNQQANRIAQKIGEQWQASPPQSPHVALLFDHGTDMITALLGVLKAGGVYIPLAPDHPLNRLSYMLANAQAALILTDSRNQDISAQAAKENHIPLINIQTLANQPETLLPNPSRTPQTNGLAYIIFTSGSTGHPKGVMQTHQNAYYYVRNWIEIFSIKATDRLTLFSSFCHDGAVQDIFSALLSGATLCPYHLKNRDNTTEAVSTFLVQEQITLWHSVPSLFRYFTNTLTGSESFPLIRFFMLGGEPIREHDMLVFKNHFPHATLANVYGQTESSVNTIWLFRWEDTFHKVIIGKPLDRTKIFIIGNQGREASPLETGEILVASEHITPGYWQNPEASKKTFGQHPKFGRIYWTGDLGRLLLNGDIEFIGRRDTQIKIRGFRIEMGEIETQLLKHPAIKEVVVTARKDAAEDWFLVAYMVKKDETEPGPSTAQLREYLAREVPDYMIPSYFMTLPRFPVTASNKIDRNALPVPEMQESSEYLPPSNEIEEKLVALWSEILGVAGEKISTRANFFELGGHSLKASTLSSKIHRTFNTRISLPQIFQAPTIKDIADFIRNSAKEKFLTIEPVEERAYYELSFYQKRLFFIQYLTPQSVSYNMHRLLSLPYPVDGELIRQVFGQLIARHESFRTRFILLEDEPVQQVLADVPVPLKTVDLSLLPAQEKQEQLIACYNQEALTPFSLQQAPLFRVTLVKLEEALYGLIFNMHHIISDGWSIELLKKEFVLYMEGNQSGVPYQPEPLTVQYKDFALWSNQQIRNAEIKEKTHLFWKAKFQEGVPPVQLPLDSYRRGDERKGAQTWSVLAEARALLLKEAARVHNTTLFRLMFALFLLLLHRVTRQEEIACAIITAGRDHEALQNIMGFFVSTELFFLRVQPDEPFSDFVQRVNGEANEMYQHQGYPLELVFEELKLKYPEIPVSFNMLNMGDTRLIPAPTQQHRETEPLLGFDAKMDLEPYITEYKDAIEIRWAYKAELFKATTIEYIINEYVKLVDFFMANPKKSYADYKSAGSPRTFLKRSQPARERE